MLTNPTVRLALGAVMISFSPVFVRLTSVDAVVSAFYRVFFGAIILICYCIFRRQLRTFNRRFVLITAMAGVMFALDLAFWHTSINLIGPGLSTLLANFQVIFLTLIGLLVFKDQLTHLKIVSIPLALAGLYLIVGGPSTNAENHTQGVIFGLLTALCYATYIVCLKFARTNDAHQTTSLHELTLATTFCAIALAIYLVVSGNSFSAPVDDLSWLFMNGLIGQTLGWLLITSSLAHLPTSRVAMLLLLQPILAFLWDILWFDRTLHGLEISGAVLALVAIYLSSIGPKPEKASSKSRDSAIS